MNQVAQNTNQWVNDKPFKLESGLFFNKLQLFYECYGELSATKDNAILIHHALSTNSHVASSKENPKNGWWENMVGSGKPIDTDQFYVICINNLGSCFGSSSPVSINPATAKPYAADFPTITMGDIANSQKLLLDFLGIKQLHGVVGSSVGAMISLTFAMYFPPSVKNLALISSAYKAYPANVANRAIQRKAIMLDPQWQQGNYTPDSNLEGFKVARLIGLLSYRNTEEWNRRFNSHSKQNMQDDEIMRYLEYNAEKFQASFDANAYLTILKSMDSFNVTLKYSSKSQAFARITAKTLVVSVHSDTLFTPQQQTELYQSLKSGGVDCYFILHQSNFGHDAFLVETEAFGRYLQDLL